MNRWSISFQYWNIVFLSQKIITDPHYDPTQWVDAPHSIVMDDSSLADCFAQLEQGHNVVVECHHPLREVVQYCMQHYRYVKAAGGVVEAPEGDRLLIYRNERWDLPKGKVEAGETLTQAAIREVEEEAGMKDLVLGDLITKTYHIFNLYGGWHLKQTTWFKMQVPSRQSIVAQEEEGITGGEWVNPDEYNKRLGGSYATLRKVRY